jgi:hypothetical protein
VTTFPFIAAPVSRAAEAAGVSETTLRQAIALGEVVVHYAGRRATKPIIRAIYLDQWVQSLPTESGRYNG